MSEATHRPAARPKKSARHHDAAPLPKKRLKEPRNARVVKREIETLGDRSQRLVVTLDVGKMHGIREGLHGYCAEDHKKELVITKVAEDTAWAGMDVRDNNYVAHHTAVVILPD